VTLVSAIVVTHRGGPLLAACLAALRTALERVDGETELLVVDNAAGVTGSDVLSLSENLGFAGGVAYGIEHSSGEWVLLVNDDAEVEPDAVTSLLAAAEWAASDVAAPTSAAVGTVTGQVRFHSRRAVINTAGLELDCLGVAWDRLAGAPATDGGPVEEVFGASACVVLYRRSMLDAVGGFDASFFAFGEDADVAWRARMAGWRALYAPESVAYHHGSATAREASAPKYFLVGRNRMRLLAKNAMTGQLLRWGWAMLLYDLAYVLFVALTDRTVAPLRGRLAGLREWRAYRRTGAPTRRPVGLARPNPLGPWQMRKAYRR
jgi:GT2 family glycosyltransferase